MSKIKVEKENVILSIEKDDLAQYEARGYKEIGVTKKADTKENNKKTAELGKKVK